MRPCVLLVLVGCTCLGSGCGTLKGRSARPAADPVGRDREVTELRAKRDYTDPANALNPNSTEHVYYNGVDDYRNRWSPPDKR